MKRGLVLRADSPPLSEEESARRRDLFRRHLAGDPEATRQFRAEIVALLEEIAAKSTNGNSRRSARATLKRIPGHPLHEPARAGKAPGRKKRHER
jgi:hypothetical protein